MKAVTLAVLLMLGACARLPQVPPAGVPAQVSAPELAAGTAWTYRTRDGYTGLPRGVYRETLTATPPGMMVVAAARDSAEETHRYTRSWDWVERPMTNLPAFRFDPPYPALPFPLTAGQQWDARVAAANARTGTIHEVRVIGKVDGWERIRVPAGEFDTLRIHRTVYAGNRDYFRGEETIEEYDWYAPELGQTVKRSRSSYHIDTSRACEPTFFTASCAVRGDWIVYELSGYGPSMHARQRIQ